MVSGQLVGLQGQADEGGALPSDPGLLGAEMLRIAIDFDSLISRGKTAVQALEEMTSCRDKDYHPVILESLKGVRVADVEMHSKVVRVLDLNDSMILAEDVCTNSGVLLAAKDQPVSLSVRKLLRNHLDQKTIPETLVVLTPVRRPPMTHTVPVQPALASTAGR